MRIARTIPPAAATINLKNLLNGLVGMLPGNRYISRLERELKEYFGVRYVFPVSSGKAALTIILRAIKKLSPDRDRVLIPAYTCFSVPSAIVKAGLTISLCDIDPATFDFDYAVVEESLDEKTLCIIPSHLFGIPSDMDRVQELCRDRGIFIVEDAAQAMGGKYKGRMIGTVGDAGLFSLGRGKNITCGSGGIIVTNSEAVGAAILEEYSRLKHPGAAGIVLDFVKTVLLSIFIHPSLYWLPSGLPFLKLGETVFHKDFPMKRLSGMQAGLLNGWQKRLEDSNKTRTRNAAYFSKLSVVRSRNELPVSFLRLPVLARNREAREWIYSLSRREGCGISRMYPGTVSEVPGLSGLLHGRGTPSASMVAQSLLTIPTHHLLTERDRRRICTLFGRRAAEPGIREQIQKPRNI